MGILRSRHRLRRCVGVIVVAAICAACSTTTGWSRASSKGAPPPLPGGPGHNSTKTPGSSKTPDDYTPPEDGSGWPTQPFDQPSPVPGFNWQGWDKHSRCDWLPPDLLVSLAIGPPRLGGHFCHIPIADGDDLQILWGESYSGISDPLDFSRKTKIAGLEARTLDFELNAKNYPGSCKVEVNTRSLSSFSVLNWSPTKRPADREARCAIATQAAELIARRLVPAAGGTGWSVTPQTPIPASVLGKSACEIVGDRVVTYVGVEKAKPTMERTADGDTCIYEQRGKRVVAFVTDSQGIAQTPSVPNAKTAPRTLGIMPARTEVTNTDCAIVVEFQTGRVLRVQYSDNVGDGRACKAAQALAAQAIHQLLEKS